MVSLSGAAFWKCFRLKGAIRCKAQTAAWGEEQAWHDSRVFFKPFTKWIYNLRQCNQKETVLHRHKHDWSTRVAIKLKANDHDIDHNILSAYYIASSMLISFLSGNGTTICYSYLQFKYISIFPYILASGIWQCFVGLLFLINPMLPCVCAWQISSGTHPCNGLETLRMCGWISFTWADLFPGLPVGIPWTGECSSGIHQLSSLGTHLHQPRIQPKI